MTTNSITTHAEGVDLKQVNLWDAPDMEQRKKVKGYFKDGDECTIMNERGEYVEVKGIGYKWDSYLQKEVPGVKVRGWCNKAFMK